MTVAAWSSPPSTPKVKKTVTLDADLVAAIGDGNLSSEVNEALTERVHRLQRAHSLRTYLDQYTATEGPFDEAEVQELMQLLGGPSGA
jgi:hypothetical protein